MKSKKIVVMSLVAVLSLGTTSISFARGGGMGGGFTGNRGTASGPSGSGFGGSRGAFHSSGQEMNGPSGGYGEQSQVRLRDTQQHRSGVPGDAVGTAAGNQWGHRNGNLGDPDGAAANNQQGYHNGSQGAGDGVAIGDRQRDNIRLRDEN